MVTEVTGVRIHTPDEKVAPRPRLSTPKAGKNTGGNRAANPIRSVGAGTAIFGGLRILLFYDMQEAGPGGMVP
jgi:hypothetical protein